MNSTSNRGFIVLFIETTLPAPHCPARLGGFLVASWRRITVFTGHNYLEYGRTTEAYAGRSSASSRNWRDRVVLDRIVPGRSAGEGIACSTGGVQRAVDPAGAARRYCSGQAVAWPSWLAAASGQ